MTVSYRSVLIFTYILIDLPQCFIKIKHLTRPVVQLCSLCDGADEDGHFLATWHFLQRDVVAHVSPHRSQQLRVTSQSPERFRGQSSQPQGGSPKPEVRKRCFHYKIAETICLALEPKPRFDACILSQQLNFYIHDSEMLGRIWLSRILRQWREGLWK